MKKFDDLCKDFGIDIVEEKESEIEEMRKVLEEAHTPMADYYATLGTKEEKKKIASGKKQAKGNTKRDKKKEDKRREEIPDENMSEESVALTESFQDLATKFKQFVIDNYGDVVITSKILDKFRKDNGLKWNDPVAKKLYVFVDKKPSEISVTPPRSPGRPYRGSHNTLQGFRKEYGGKYDDDTEYGDAPGDDEYRAWKKRGGRRY